MEKIELKENEYLLKIRGEGVEKYGFLTKYNKNGSMPKAFEGWGRDLPIQVHVEDFKRGWKFVSYRVGESQSWATVEHPDGFKLEIYLSNLMKIVEYSTIVKGEIIGKFKWVGKELVSELDGVSRDRLEKIGKLQSKILVKDITNEILKTENDGLIDKWNQYQELK